MALDVVILGDEEKPVATVSVGVDVHSRLMKMAIEHTCLTLARMRDYYADANYSARDLDVLEREIVIVSRASGDDVELQRVLRDLDQLIDAARRQGRGLSALAD